MAHVQTVEKVIKGYKTSILFLISTVHSIFYIQEKKNLANINVNFGIGLSYFNYFNRVWMYMYTRRLQPVQEVN